MKINIKPITSKSLEWFPAQNIYFSQEVINDIIEEEKLKENMVCKQGVIFNHLNQEIDNVVYNCIDYNGEYIYLVQTNDFVKEREYFFAYVSNKDWNTANKVVLTLKIDVITSNYDLFYDNKFKGRAYIERTNNYQRSINDFHSQTCVNIENIKYSILEQEIETDFNTTHTFIESSLKLDEKKTLHVISSPEESPNFDIEQKGTLVMNNTTQSPIRFIGYSAINSSFKKLQESYPLPTLIDTILAKYSNSNVSDSVWNFDTEEKRLNFVSELKSDYPVGEKHLLDEIDNIIKQLTLRKWLTIPKIFNDIGENTIEDFIINTSIILPEYNLTNHYDLHQEYYLILNNLFEIKIDIRLLEKNIYGTRIISSEGVKFLFYYDQNKLNNFYTLSLNIQNSTQSQNLEIYQRDLALAYQYGQKGFSSQIPNLLTGFLTLVSGVGISALSGGSLGGIALLGYGFNQLINSGYNSYKEYKQNEYDKAKILASQREEKNVLLFDVLNMILPKKSLFFQWSYWKYNTNIGLFEGYTNFYQYQKENNLNTNIRLRVKTPISDDINKIKQDQSEYGNIVNQEFLDKDNVLEFNDLTENHLYFQGKIQPIINPIDNFMLDVLNQTLATGVYIWKKIPDSFRIQITSPIGDFNIKTNSVGIIDDINITSPSNTISIKDVSEK